MALQNRIGQEDGNRSRWRQNNIESNFMIIAWETNNKSSGLFDKLSRIKIKRSSIILWLLIKTWTYGL
jgi:hypothetical protein